METNTTFQLKCEKCGAVQNIAGPLREMDKRCPNCQEIITESGIAEIKTDSFLLE